MISSIFGIIYDQTNIIGNIYNFIIQNMGAIRSLPQNHVNTLTQNHQTYYFATVSACGWQYYMEDYQISITQGPVNLFVILDGHNGPQVAQFCHQHIPKLFQQNSLIKMGQYRSGIESMLSELQVMIQKSGTQINLIRKKHKLPQLHENDLTRSGCSIGIVLFNEQDIVIGTIGECRCYVSYRKDPTKAVLFSGNHTVSNRDQEARIVKAGGFILNDRVNGMYPFTRSIGDFHLKKKKCELISSQPSTFAIRRQDISKIIMGSSGVWQKSQTIVKAAMQAGKNMENDRQRLQNLVGSLIAKQGSYGKMQGYQNMIITCICFQ